MRLTGFLLLLPLAASAAPALPPPPDSLRALVHAAHTPVQRVDAWLRVSAAFGVALDSAGTLRYAEAAETLARRLPDSVRAARATLLRGTHYLQVGQPVTAAPLLREAAAVLTTRGTAPDRTTTLLQLGTLCAALNRYDQSARYLRQARALAATLDSATQVQALLTSATAYQRRGAHDSAAWFGYRGLALSRRLGDVPNQVSALATLALSAYYQNDVAAATRLQRQGYALQRQRGPHKDMAAMLSGLAALALQADSLTAALAYYRAEGQVLQQFLLPGRLYNVYNGLAVTYERLHRPDSAEWYFRRAVAALEPVGDLGELGYQLVRAATFFHNQGRAGEATRWAERALALEPGRFNPEYTADACQLLRTLAIARHDLPRAYALLLRERHDDSLRQTTANAQLAQELRVGYETDQLEARARQLEQNAEIAALRRRQQNAATTAAGGLAVLLLGGGVWRLRRRQRQREQTLRTQLAADLHDDVGSLLSQISIQSALIREGLVGDPDQQRRQLDEVALACRTAVGLLNDVVWALDAHNDPLANLFDRLRDHANQVLPAAGIRVRIHLPPADQPLPPLPVLARRNVYLIFKESLHNIVKHAAATEVTIDVTLLDHQLRLQVQDNGLGAAAKPAGASAYAAGHGLRNIERRAVEAGGGATVGSMPTGGFAVQAWVKV